MAVLTVFVVFVRVPERPAAPLPVAPPVMPAPPGNPQLYVVTTGTVPFTPSAGVKLKLPPLHIVAVIAFTAGIGVIVTDTVNDAPVQVPLKGVTVYVAV